MNTDDAVTVIVILYSFLVGLEKIFGLSSAGFVLYVVLLVLGALPLIPHIIHGYCASDSRKHSTNTQ